MTCLVDLGHFGHYPQVVPTFLVLSPWAIGQNNLKDWVGIQQPSDVI